MNEKPFNDLFNLTIMKNEKEDAEKIPWACFDCGYVGENFRTIYNYEGGFPEDCLCNECGSFNNAEASEVLREKMNEISDLKAENEALEKDYVILLKEVERLTNG